MTEHPDFDEDVTDGSTTVFGSRKAYDPHLATSLTREVEDMVYFVDRIDVPKHVKAQRVSTMYRKVQAAPDFPAGPGWDDKRTLLATVGMFYKNYVGGNL